jgi:hypothetical protein
MNQQSAGKCECGDSPAPFMVKLERYCCVRCWNRLIGWNTHTQRYEDPCPRPDLRDNPPSDKH